MQVPVHDFLCLEARLLDKRRFDEWLSLYTDDAEYWVPVLEDQESPYDELSIIFDTRQMMEARVFRLGQATVHSQQPKSRACRLIGNVTVELNGGSQIITRSALLLTEHRANRQFQYAAHVEHRLVREGSGLKIRRKRVNLVNSEGNHEMISLPF